MKSLLCVGQLADQFGGKGVLAAGVTVWSLFTLTTPFAAAAGLPILIVNRVAMGLGEGVAFPAVHALVGEQERHVTCTASITKVLSPNKCTFKWVARPRLKMFTFVRLRSASCPGD